MTRAMADGRAYRSNDAKRRRAAEVRAGKAKCARCRRMRPLEEFGWNSREKHYRYAYCNACHSEYQRKLRLLKVFDMTPVDYDELVAFQGGGCAICGRPEADIRGGRLVIDHDHETGLVRGLLCTYDNRLLTPAMQRRVAKFATYLQNPPATAALGREVQGPIGSASKRKRRKKR